MSTNSLFHFLKNIDENLAQMAESIESQLYTDPHAVLTKARLFAEKLAKKVMDQEDYNEVYEYTQYERIRFLYKEGVIDDDVKSYFDSVRKAGNKASHEGDSLSVSDGIMAHRYLFQIAVWFVELYGDVNFKAPKYELPKAQGNSNVEQSELEQIVAKSVQKTITETFEEKFKLLQEELKQAREAAVPPQRQNEQEVVETAEPESGNNESAEKDQSEDEQQVKRVTTTESTEGTPIADYLESKGYEVVDKREKGGALWIIGDWGIKDDLFALKDQGVYFRFAKKGSQATKRKPAWFLLNKKPVFITDETPQITEQERGPIEESKPEPEPKQTIEQPKTVETVTLAGYLKQKQLEVIDKREGGGTLWVVGGWELSDLLLPLKKQKVYFRFAKKGSQATKHKPAWFLMGKKKEEVYVTIETDVVEEQEPEKPEFQEPVEKEEPIENIASQKDEEPSIKRLTFNGQQLTLEREQQEKEINIDDFPSCQHFVQGLSNIKITTLGELPESLDGFHTQVKGSGPKAVEKFWDHLQQLLNQGSKEATEIEVEPGTLFLNNKTYQVPEILFDLSIDKFSFQGVDSVVSGLKDNGYERIRDLPNDLSSLQNLKGVGLGRVERFFAQLIVELEHEKKTKERAEKLASMTPEEQEIFLFTEATEQVKALEDPVTRKGFRIVENDYKMMKRRHERFLNGENYSIGALGNDFGVTRQRIQQMLKRFAERVLSLMYDWHEFVKLPIEETGFFEKTLDETLFEHFIITYVLDDQGIRYDDELNMLTNVSKQALEDEKGKLAKMMRNDLRGSLLTDHELESYFNNWAESLSVPPHITKAWSKQLVMKTSETNEWILKNSTNADITEMVMKQYPKGVEVYKNSAELIRKGNAIKAGTFRKGRDFASIVLRDEEADKYVMWGRGLYIHHSFLKKSYDILEEMKDHAVVLLKKRDIILIGKIYSMFEKELNHAGIPSEYALYDLLRRNYSDELIFPKYPRIANEGAQIGFNFEQMRDFIEQKGRPVKTEELMYHFVTNLGWKPFTVQYNLSTHESFISYDHAQVALLHWYEDRTKEDLQPIVDSVRQQLEHHDSIQIYGVYKQTESLCRSLNIETPHLLYALLRERFGDELHFIRFPHIVAEVTDNPVTVNSLVESYILEQGMEVSRDELETWFIDEVGARQEALYNALLIQSILTYKRSSNSEYIHKDVIGYNEELREKLYEVVHTYVKEQASSEKPYVITEEVIEGTALPPLQNEIEWTADLLVSCLRQDERFLLVGTTHHIIVDQDKAQAIKDPISFVAHVLQHQFGGETTLTELRRQLNKIRFSSDGQWTKEMKAIIDDGQAPFIENGEKIMMKSVTT
ncbi:DUF4145 domain-containing protein [Bacillus shivajii]|uniref:DUF4145 domain-containing protein n=1 Tax=Bacillus shivajii TaxID=1983719 RepID=UPI001CFA0812|nr:DUF4145 domain-containing protein [Bacillus shivajii]UCZ53461.1 DUF4145 domain-containing protein [Bacillus shivajii]